MNVNQINYIFIKIDWPDSLFDYLLHFEALYTWPQSDLTLKPNISLVGKRVSCVIPGTIILHLHENSGR